MKQTHDHAKHNLALIDTHTCGRHPITQNDLAQHIQTRTHTHNTQQTKTSLILFKLITHHFLEPATERTARRRTL